MDTLAEIHERHEAVRDVERKLLDLQQVFNQFIQLTWLSYIFDGPQQIRLEWCDILKVNLEIHVVDFNKYTICYACM